MGASLRSLRLPSVAILRVIAFGFVLCASAGSPAQRDTPCVQACHRAKSEAYQSCRAIRADDRTARQSCFSAADAALVRCLKKCR